MNREEWRRWERGQDCEHPGMAYETWRRKLGGGYARFTLDEQAEASRLVEAGASGDEVRAFLDRVVTRAINEEERLRAN